MNDRKNLQAELEKLDGQTGPRYWRGLEELADSPAFEELMRREFPEQADVWPDALSRRRFLSLMGASLALAGLGGCSVKPSPQKEIVPYVHPPEEVVPGVPLFYATAMTHGGAGVGLLVESHMGRPTKVEGNPDHPASLGATSIFHQASVLTLYDPDRSRNVTALGQERTWDAAKRVLRPATQKQLARRGAGLRILTESVVSPSLTEQLNHLLEAFPEAKWHQYEPVNSDMAHRGARRAFGRYVNTVYRFDKAEVALSLDADFFTNGAAGLRYAHDFMARRRVRAKPEEAGKTEMSRLYVVETDVTCTGAKADHRLAASPREVGRLARALASEIGLDVGNRPDTKHEKWIKAAAEDLKSHRGRSLVVPGDHQPPEVHVLAHALNHELGNVGTTVTYTEPIQARPVDQLESLRELVADMEQGEVEFLLILGGNPVYTAPVDLDFAEALKKVTLQGQSAHLSLYQDETSRLCQWHLPLAHFLEAWEDTRAFDGTATIVQPLIEPLYQGRAATEVLSLLADEEPRPARQIVRDYWRQAWEDAGSDEDFEVRWETALHDGVIPDTALPPVTIALQENWQAQLTAASPGPAPPEPAPPDGLEIAFRPDPSIYDGSFANNGWLQELPKPITKLTWDNAALLSTRTADRLGLSRGDYAHGGEHGGYAMPVVELELDGRRVEAAVWIVPGHADDAVTVSLGYGRKYAGRVGGFGEVQVGFDAYALRTSDNPWSAAGLKIKKTGKMFPLACTQAHHLMEGREPVRSGTLDQYRADARFLDAKEESEAEEAKRTAPPLTLYEPWKYKPPLNKWAMSIDLTTCIGCNACVVACQAENNIPVVGKDQVLAGREMHWLRVDRYLEGPHVEPRHFYFQPVPCMQCEQAPCEYVCPVEATAHSAEGLNDMTYNRCVGTRFCSNNCPYKVRRFNFFLYSDWNNESVRRLQYNPDVTVRSRGVMEKCTYCVQRIRQAEIDAQAQDRPIHDGEVLTACQAACPTLAIIFGDLNDPQSVVTHEKESPLEYTLLEELNTHPRTTYLAALHNPNPHLE